MFKVLVLGLFVFVLCSYTNGASISSIEEELKAELEAVPAGAETQECNFGDGKTQAFIYDDMKKPGKCPQLQCTYMNVDKNTASSSCLIMDVEPECKSEDGSPTCCKTAKCETL